jgi:hypothetical protein
MEDNLYIFEDLNFIQHPGVPHGVKAIMTFSNGYSLTVCGDLGDIFHGDGINTFEVWASCDDNSKTNLTKKQVSEYMKTIQLIRVYDDPFEVDHFNILF